MKKSEINLPEEVMKWYDISFNDEMDMLVIGHPIQVIMQFAAITEISDDKQFKEIKIRSDQVWVTLKTHKIDLSVSVWEK